MRDGVAPSSGRDEYWAKQAATNPDFGAYQHKTTRIIPVIELRRVGS